MNEKIEQMIEQIKDNSYSVINPMNTNEFVNMVRVDYVIELLQTLANGIYTSSLKLDVKEK